MVDDVRDELFDAYVKVCGRPSIPHGNAMGSCISSKNPEICEKSIVASYLLKISPKEILRYTGGNTIRLQSGEEHICKGKNIAFVPIQDIRNENGIFVIDTKLFQDNGVEPLKYAWVANYSRTGNYMRIALASEKREHPVILNKKEVAEDVYHSTQKALEIDSTNILEGIAITINTARSKDATPPYYIRIDPLYRLRN